MRKRNLAVLLIVVMYALTMTGCGKMVFTPKIKVHNEAFGKKKTFAVVSISGSKEFYGQGGISQMFKSVDKIPGKNTQPIINKLRPKIIKSLAKSKNFRLLKEKKVLKSKAYKKVKSDPLQQKAFIFTVDMNVAKGYKYIVDKEKMAKLAKDLRVDAVVAVSMSFSIVEEKGKLTIAGLSLGKKKYKASVSTSAVAYDRQGKVVWQDVTIKETAPGDSKMILGLDFSDMTKTNFKKLHPKAIRMGEKTMGVLMTRLSDKLAGKKISRFQDMDDESLQEKNKSKK